ncbi:dual specificity protein phosphatase 14-like [Macrobrachium nipponense]|uniref:dual specificity protein phosphatase 14-like n=1 Tax=Macrobrachium nipponense TaxID=159736 RepID=UPI0030C81C6F
MPENLSKPDVVRLTPGPEKEKSFNVGAECNCLVESSPQVVDKPRNRSGGRTNQVSAIESWLYLSGARAVKPSRLKELGITCVVDCTIELPNLPLDGIELVKVLVSDTPSSSLNDHFDLVADKIEEVRRRKGRVLVHCIAGVSRSPALVLAYLVKHRGMSLRQAFLHVRSIRPNVRPNAGFFKQLIEFERRARGSTSVTLVHDAALGLTIPDVCEDELRILKDTRWARLIHERRNFQRLYA